MTVKTTDERILDAAESLFAINGYHGTSIRAVTSTAGVNIAAVNYHFGSKENLLDAVLKRCIVPLNEERARRMNEVLDKSRRAATRPDARDLLRAFIEPSLEFAGSSESSRATLRIVQQAMAGQDSTAREVFFRLMSPFMKYFYAAMKSALPEIDENQLGWRMHFVLGAVSHTMRMSVAEKMPPFVKTRIAASELGAMLVDFLSAGMAS